MMLVALHMPGKPRSRRLASDRMQAGSLVRDTDLNEPADAADATRELSQEG